jgi:diguanylate cyclase (GGDEF)-like protein/putative nucleotidyltransferase with HDIG domain
LAWRIVLRRRTQAHDDEANLTSYSQLHFLGKAVAESSAPEQVANEALYGALQILGATEGFLLLSSEGPESLNQTASKGLGPVAAERLAHEPLRSYLASSGERWGSLMVFPDLERADLIAAWQRDCSFREFHRVLAAEGVRTLVALELRWREKTLGVILIGWGRIRHLKPADLRVALAVGNQVCVALENWQLTRAAELHAEQLRALHRVGEALRSTCDLSKQVAILRRELPSLLGPASFSMFFQDSAEGPLEAVTSLGKDHSEASHPASPANGLAEYVLRHHSPLLIAENLRETVGRLGVGAVDPRLRTWCGVPIHFSDGSAFVLAFEVFEREHGINARQFELVQVLAQEAAGALDNARLFQKEQRRARHLALLNELGRKAMAVLNPQELLPNLCQQIQSSFGYDAARVEILDPERRSLIVNAQAGYETQVLGRHSRLGEGLPGVVAETGEPVLAKAVLQDSRYVALHPGVQSALSLPLKYREKLLGVLTLESCHENAFSQQDGLTLRTLADQLAIALHNAQAYQLAVEQAINDGLTGLKTHRYFMETLDREWRQATRSGQQFCVIMLDLDGFKQVNDQYGHLEGDKVLASVAGLLTDRVRQSNVLARYGGDEFALLMPKTNIEQARILAERLRSAIEADPSLRAYGITGSFGIAGFPTHGATQEEILRVADAGIYLAKHQKGNLVRVAPVTPEASQSEVEQQLLEAYLGVAVKRMFSTGPEAFNQYLERLEQVNAGDGGEGPSLLDTVTALAFAIDAKDHYTQGHSQAVSRLAQQLARQLELTDAEVEEIRLAGILHDIGKIGVPESVLNKPARLTPEEYELMKTHAVLGEKILEPLKVKAIERIRRMVRHHHEAFDGQGYPDQLSGNAIPLGARVIKVADCFDTMVSERSYKQGKSVEEAVAELRRCSGTQFDPALVDAFVRSFDGLGDPRQRQALKEVAN